MAPLIDSSRNSRNVYSTNRHAISTHAKHHAELVAPIRTLRSVYDERVRARREECGAPRGGSLLPVQVSQPSSGKANPRLGSAGRSLSFPPPFFVGKPAPPWSDNLIRGLTGQSDPECKLSPHVGSVFTAFSSVFCEEKACSRAAGLPPDLEPCRLVD